MRRKSTAATTGSRARCCARSSCGSGRTPPDPFFGNASNLPQRLPARPEIAEQIGRHLAHLNLFRALCDAVAAMVAIDVLERLVPRSEGRRVGKEGVSTCRSRWSPYNLKKK